MNSKEELNIFLYNVAWLRSYYGLSKKRMAELSAIGVRSINKTESGQLPPNLEVGVIFNIAHHFGIRPEKLMSKRLNETNLSYDEIVFQEQNTKDSAPTADI